MVVFHDKSAENTHIVIAAASHVKPCHDLPFSFRIFSFVALSSPVCISSFLLSHKLSQLITRSPESTGEILSSISIDREPGGIGEVSRRLISGLQQRFEVAKTWVSLTSFMSATTSLNDALKRFAVAAALGDVAVLESLWTTLQNDEHFSLSDATMSEAIAEYDIAKGDSLLIVAVKHAQLAAVQWLLAHRCSLTSEDWSAVDYAAHRGHTAILAELLKTNLRMVRHGLTYPCRDRLTPLDRAIHGGHLQCTLSLEDVLSGQTQGLVGNTIHTSSAAVTSGSSVAPASQPVSDTTASTLSYARWGGWAAALCSCDDLPSLRQQDREVDRLLSKLDLLTECKTDVVDAFIACEFTAEDRNRLSSPLLDGLWFAATLELPSASAAVATASQSASTMLNQQRHVDHQRLLMRLVRARMQFADAVEFLLERGADCTLNHCEALEIACARDHVQICKVLFRFGASLSQTKPHHLLFDAVGYCSNDMVDLLLQHGADLRAMNHLRKSVLEHAIECRDCPDRVTWLLARGLSLQTAYLARYALLAAIQYSRRDTFQFLLQYIRSGYETAVSASNGSAAATASDSTEPKASGFAAYLEALPPHDDDDGPASLLHYAAANPNPSFAKTLLEIGLNVNAPDERGPPLMHACQRGGHDTAKVLIEHGALVNVEALEWTPLSVAVTCGDLQIVRLLVDSGADLEATAPDSDETALVIAVVDGQGQTGLEIVRFLLDRGAMCEPGIGTELSDPVLFIAVARRWFEVIEMLLDRGADINRTSLLNGITVLHDAAANVDLTLCRLLLERGADPNARDSLGQTPLHHLGYTARPREYDERVNELWQVLLDFNASPEAKDDTGRTASEYRMRAPHRPVLPEA